MQALAVYAGPRAMAHLLRIGLQPHDVHAIPAAAGGPKGLVLNHLDRFIFGHWLQGATQSLHLLGASIGAWRMACACRQDPAAALAELAEDYITQSYEHEPGKAPTPEVVSRMFGRAIEARLGTCAQEILSHPHRRLHVFTSHGRGLLHREGRWRTPVGYACAFAANAVKRQALGQWLERVVFSDPREPLPFALSDFPSQLSALGPHNLVPAVLASCSIPFWLRAVHDVPGGPLGAYWDGGITDYHLHLNYQHMSQGLVLYPHFQAQVVPGWLDKAWKSRHRATDALSNVIVLAPSAQWVRTLPQGKLPDRQDFNTFGDDLAGRQQVWRRALAQSQQLADDFAQFLHSPAQWPIQPLA